LLKISRPCYLWDTPNTYIHWKTHRLKLIDPWTWNSCQSWWRMRRTFQKDARLSDKRSCALSYGGANYEFSEFTMKLVYFPWIRGLWVLWVYEEKTRVLPWISRIFSVL
jgi:hypothetical protein